MSLRPSRRSALLLASLLALAACSDEPPSPSPDPTAGAADGTGAFAEIPDIVDAVAPSVVSVLRSDGGQGSGVVWDESGIVVTNNHVVDGARAVVIALASGERIDAEVVATDPRSDLAVLRAEREDLPAADFREDLPDVGELALAIGTPLGFENTVTAGIVSGLHRGIPGAAQQAPALVDLVQTDAAISPGNSGGALVDEEGRVIGINVAYLPPNPPSGRGAVAIGFAIPSPTVRDVVEQLLENGTVEHAYLGIRPATLTPSLADQLGIDGTGGVAVLDVIAGSPAAAAGIEPGDLLVELAGEPLETAEDLLGALRRAKPGDTVELTAVRDGEEAALEVELGDLPMPSG